MKGINRGNFTIPFYCRAILIFCVTDYCIILSQVSLDPPIKQGQTRYPFIVFTFNSDDEEISIELPLSEEELKEKYDGKLSKELSGQTYDVLGSIMKVMTNTKITVPGNFIGASGTPAVGCSYKAAAGYLYPLERGFMFVHKPPMHIRFEEISSVNFARGAGSMTRYALINLYHQTHLMRLESFSKTEMELEMHSAKRS